MGSLIYYFGNQKGKAIFTAVVFILLNLWVHGVFAQEQDLEIELPQADIEQSDDAENAEEAEDAELSEEEDSLEDEEGSEDAMNEAHEKTQLKSLNSLYLEGKKAVDEKTILERYEVPEAPSLSLNAYNIFKHIKKEKQPLQLIHSAFSQFVYGPYEPIGDVYVFPYPSPEELTQRVIAIKKNIEDKEAAKEFDKELIEMKVHLGDLYAMKFSKTGQNKYIYEAVAIYKEIYSDIPDKILESTNINMAKAFIHAEDFATAFPIVKKISKQESSVYHREIQNTLLEFYFASERYQKADELVDVKINSKELSTESEAFMIRAGDVMFFLRRYEDAANWFQTVLKPKKKASNAENLSWLYLAESLFQLNNHDISRKIFNAMQPFFKGTEHESIVKFRLEENISGREKLSKIEPNRKIRMWMRVEVLTEQFKNNPKLFTGEYFDNLLQERGLHQELRRQVQFLQAYAFRNQNKDYEAIKIFHKLEIRTKNRFLRKAINDIIVSSLFKAGFSNTNSDQAFKYLRFLISLKYNLRSHSPDEIYALLYHNLKLIGLENASAELTLRVIEQSIHHKKDQAYISFKLAENMYDAFAYRASMKTLRQIDTKLLDSATKETYHKLLVKNLLKIRMSVDAIEALNTWEKEGASAENAMWIALKKTEIFYKLKRYQEAMEIIENTIGNTPPESLPRKIQKLAMPLLAYRVILHNKLGSNNECLVSFYKNQNIIMKSSLKPEIIFATISSALAMNKSKDVTKLLLIGKTYLDENSYMWLEKWTKGEMWINQINKYLEKSNLAIKGENKS